MDRPRAAVAAIPARCISTGKLRDAETGLDDFPARYYSSVQGRWYSPDWSPVPVAIPYVNLGDPRTLNLYAYVGDDPTNHPDADGHQRPNPRGLGLAQLSTYCPTERNCSTGYVPPSQGLTWPR